MTAVVTTPPYQNWEYGATLPNLYLSGKTPFESDYMAIVGPDDPRLAYPEEDPRFSAARCLQSAFVTSKGKPFRPCALLIASSFANKKRLADAVRSFRDIAAFTTVLTSRAGALAEDAQWVPLYSDFLDLFPFVPSKSGTSLHVLDLPVFQYDKPSGYTFHAHEYLAVSSAWSVRPDGRLWELLVGVWKREFAEGRDQAADQRLLRSLNIAFHAARFPSDGLTSIHDIGVRMGLWVSAIEILLHPAGAGARIHADAVIDDIGRIAWEAPTLRARRYSIQRRRGKQENIRATFAQNLYDRLYDGRNNYLHGEPVSLRDVFLRERHPRQRLDFCAPLLYGALLLQQLKDTLRAARTISTPADWASPEGQEALGSALRDRWSQSAIEGGLLAVRTGRKPRRPRGASQGPDALAT